MNETLQRAITVHSQWKYRLQKAVKTGQSPLTVEDSKNHHQCELGKWLDSPAGKALSNWDELNQLHQQFHEEASHILALALAGNPQEAEEKMQLGSRFSQLTARLVTKIAALDESLKV